jgi:hypothetical protein
MAPRKKTPAIHTSIKTALGYKADEIDTEVLRDWRKRTSRVCKPCWELKYCPYGPLVEQAPLLPIERAEIVGHDEYLHSVLASGVIGNVRNISEEEKAEIRALLSVCPRTN